MRVFKFIDSLLAGPTVENQAQVFGYGSREHLGELDVRPLPQALSPHEPVAKREVWRCLLYTSPSPRDKRQSRMPSSA